MEMHFIENPGMKVRDYVYDDLGEEMNDPLNLELIRILQTFILYIILAGKARQKKSMFT